jgi:hypothetical protein
MCNYVLQRTKWMNEWMGEWMDELTTTGRILTFVTTLFVYNFKIPMTLVQTNCKLVVPYLIFWRNAFHFEYQYTSEEGFQITAKTQRKHAAQSPTAEVTTTAPTSLIFGWDLRFVFIRLVLVSVGMCGSSIFSSASGRMWGTQSDLRTPIATRYCL